MPNRLRMSPMTSMVVASATKLQRSRLPPPRRNRSLTHLRRLGNRGSIERRRCRSCKEHRANAAIFLGRCLVARKDLDERSRGGADKTPPDACANEAKMTSHASSWMRCSKGKQLVHAARLHRLSRRLICSSANPHPTVIKLKSPAPSTALKISAYQLSKGIDAIAAVFSVPTTITLAPAADRQLNEPSSLLR